ncbi:MAG TPA: NADH:flavin oxidoreductase [Methanomicrobia archaeon]|nr:NADH:flavin oxidoreductase [Methanomicrobia archaeon]
MSTLFDAVFQPPTVGGVTLPNRIVFPAVQTNYATTDGLVTDRLLRFYREIARGGTGLTMVGCTAVSPDGAGATNMLRLTTGEHEASCAELFAAIKATGSLAAAQLIHFGRQTRSAITKQPLVAASAIPCPVMQERPRELTVAEILRIEDDFARAAVRAKRAGADLIEIHAAFGYLLGGFLSAYSNKRSDEYGGSLANRVRFVREVIASVRAAVGGLPLSCRISAVEFVEGGLRLEETRKIAPMLVDAGPDVISVAAGTYASMEHMVPGKELGEAVHVPLAAAIKAVVDVPVICAGNIRCLALAQQILEVEQADLVAIGRAQVADPQLVNKSKNGQLDQITACDHCQHCAYWLSGEPALSCPQNPRL